MGANFSSVHDFNASMEGKKWTVIEIETRKQWKSLFDSIKEIDKLLVINFCGIWCGPCKTMEPKVKAIAENYKEVVFVKVDVDKLSDVAMSYQANVLPAFVFVKRGKEIDRIVGAKETELLNKIEKHMVSF